MTQFHSVPASTGPEHRVKPTALALHVASAAAWGRPWRRGALSLPSPRGLTFQGIRLPMQPLRSWLHLLSRAGMLGARSPEPALSVLRRPEEDEEDAPSRIEELGFELSTEMILDFAQFARQSRTNAAAEQLPPEAENSDVDEPSAMESSVGIDELHALGMAGSVSSESVDQDFLTVGGHEVQESIEVAAVLHEQGAESTPALESQVALDELRIAPTADATDAPVLTDRPEFLAVQVAPQTLENVESPETPSLEVVAQVEPPAEIVVELPAQEVTLNEVPEVEAQVATTEMEPGLEPVADVAAESAQQAMGAPATVVRDAEAEEQSEQLQAQMLGVAQDAEAEAPEVEVESEVGLEPEPEPESVLHIPKAAAPVIVVSGVRLARKPAAPEKVPAKHETSAQVVEGPQMEGISEPSVEGAVKQPLAEPVAVTEEPEVRVAETITVSAPIAEETSGQANPEASDAPVQPEMESLADVMHWQPAEPDHEPELTQVDVQERGPVDDAAVADDFGFEPMIASLEDALAVLAAANAVHEEPSAVQVAPVVVASPAPSDFAPLAADVQWADNNIPEVPTLQGIFIQKETEMTEMRDESIEGAAQAATAPITSVELQEVAATLSVPQLEADPDDVLSDVQSTLNSLAGMAQGLTQQKQAAGRLQEELEEWNNQLQERERLASDKEERLQQLETHLKEAKTNLDRMAAENNRLLAERSEALKELAQTVDLRDKTTVKRAESIQLEQQRIDEQAAGLRHRASELDERESGLKRKSEELGVRLKQLQSAKDKFSTIVKSFNETVQFNSTLSAISKTVNE